MDLHGMQSSIIQRLETGLTSAKVIQNTAEPQDVVNAPNNMFDPYVVVTFGGPIEAANGRHMSNRRMNLLLSWTIITCVAPIDEDAVKIKSEVIDLLWGFSPDDASEMVMTGGTAQSSTNSALSPYRFMHTVMFQIPHNMSGVVK